MKKSARASQNSYLIDQITPRQLTKMLKTLQNIHNLSKQLEEDINVTFEQIENLDSSQEYTNSNIFQIKNFNNFSKSDEIEVICKKTKTQKMNFQFYKQNKQNMINKSTSKLSKRNQNKSPKQIRMPKRHNKQNSQIRQVQKRVQDLSLTKRSLNTTILKEVNMNVNKMKSIRLKTEVDQKQNKKFFCIQNKSTKCNIKERQNNNKQNQKQIIYPPKEKCINNLKMHQRTIQFLKQKNEKIAKLAQQVEMKRIIQERQCTFRPKIIENYGHIKPKYNNLYTQRSIQRIKKTKQDKEAMRQKHLKSTLKRSVSKDITITSKPSQTSRLSLSPYPTHIQAQ